jgi:hypothetical protein
VLAAADCTLTVGLWEDSGTQATPLHLWPLTSPPRIQTRDRKNQATPQAPLRLGPQVWRQSAWVESSGT